MQHRSGLWAPKLFYLGWYTALGVYSPFITLYYRERGLDLAQIGLLLALPGLMQIVAGPLWGMLADALRLHRVLLPLAIFVTLVPAALIGRSETFLPILGLAVLLGLFTVPVTPLADSATMALLGKHPERYGAQRAWGAVGWGVSTVAAGFLVERFGLGAIFWAYPVAGALAGLAAIALPSTALRTTNLASAIGQVVRDLRWARLLFCSLLIGCASTLMHGFLSIYLDGLGASRDQIGLAYTIASVSELPVMALAPLALRRWGARPMLICAGLTYALRMLIYLVAPAPEWALGAQLLHGLCFATLWTAGVHEAQRLAPAGFEATAQSLFGSAVFGIAVVVANMAGGLIYQGAGASALFIAAAALALLGALGFALPLPERDRLAASGL